MTKQEVFQRIMESMYNTLNASEEFRAACDLLEEGGLLPRVEIMLRLYDDPRQAPSAAASADSAIKIEDAEFLRLLRIDPNLEIK